MVIVKDTAGMFWGVTLDNGKRYSQIVEQSFHISMACLEPKQAGVTGEGDASSGGHVSVMIQHQDADFMLCTLTHGKQFQQALDLSFVQGEEITFYLNGIGTVHLTGYLLDEPDMNETTDMMGMNSMEEFSDEDVSDEENSDEESDENDDTEMTTTFGELDTTQSTDEEDDDWTASQSHKRKLQHALKAAKKLKGQKDEDEDDVEDFIDDESMEATGFTDSEEDSDDLIEDSDISKDKTPNLKVQNKKGTKSSEKKGQGQQQKPPSTTKVNTSKVDVIKMDGKSGKKDKKQKQSQNTVPVKTPKSEKKPTAQVSGTAAAPASAPGSAPALSKAAKKRLKRKAKQRLSLPDGGKPPPDVSPHAAVLEGGTAIVDDYVGHGLEAKTGKMLAVYYTARLANKAASFDECLAGKPFKFRLGSGEVIPGWDVGVRGMKVGGRRTVIVPPSQAYGSRPHDEIPANSTLVFSLQLLAVS